MEVPCIGMDIGGTLTKVVYFQEKDHLPMSSKLEQFLFSSEQYGSTGRRDDKLAFEIQEDNEEECELIGKFNFIKFETRRMPQAIGLIEQNHLHENFRTICCTGGGAFKFADEMHRRLGLEIEAGDEFECLIRGLDFVLRNVANETYFLEPAGVITEKIVAPFQHHIYPLLLVNIGSGVSILKLDSEKSFTRVSGSSLGGGTFWGLARMLTKCKDCNDVFDISKDGDNTHLDMLVGDIYGCDYSSFGLNADIVASSFGKMVMINDEDPPPQHSDADVANALLKMVSNNIAQLAFLNAKLHNVQRIYFAGNFLRHNPIAMAALSFGVNYWSSGDMKAYFLQHEGFCGAIGALLRHRDRHASEQRRGSKTGPLHTGNTPRETTAAHAMTPEERVQKELREQAGGGGGGGGGAAAV